MNSFGVECNLCVVCGVCVCVLFVDIVVAGTAGEGIGGPHEGVNYAWPMAITMQAMTSKDDEEVCGMKKENNYILINLACLTYLAILLSCMLIVCLLLSPRLVLFVLITFWWFFI